MGLNKILLTVKDILCSKPQPVEQLFRSNKRNIKYYPGNTLQLDNSVMVRVIRYIGINFFAHLDKRVLCHMSGLIRLLVMNHIDKKELEEWLLFDAETIFRVF